MGINIGPRVLGFASLAQDTGCNLVDLAIELEEGVVGKVLEGELPLGGVTRVLIDIYNVSWNRDKRKEENVLQSS